MAPVIAAGGFVLAAQGEKAVTKAMEYRAEVNKKVASMKELIAVYQRAEERIDELEGVLQRINVRASAKLDELFDGIDVFDDKSDADLASLSTAMLLCKALSGLLHVRVLDDDCQLDQASEVLIARYRALVGDT